jgi:hypothetical protein
MHVATPRNVPAHTASESDTPGLSHFHKPTQNRPQKAPFPPREGTLTAKLVDVA